MQYSYCGLTMGAFHLVYKTEEKIEQLMHRFIFQNMFLNIKIIYFLKNIQLFYIGHYDTN